MPGKGKGSGFSWWWLLTPVLAAGLWVEFSYPKKETIQPLAPPVGSEENPIEKLVFSFPAAETFNQIVVRPLFTAMRRPPPPQDGQEERLGKLPQPARLNKYQLTAVVITGDQRLAMFRDTSTGSVFRRIVGGEIDGWLVDEVLPEEVVVSNNGASHKLVLRDYPAPPLPRKAVKPRKKRQVRSQSGAQPGSELKRLRRRLDKTVARGELTGPEPVELRRPHRPLRQTR